MLFFELKVLFILGGYLPHLVEDLRCPALLEIGLSKGFFLFPPLYLAQCLARV